MITPASAPTRILVVDDEASIRNLLRACLESAGFSIHLAESGLQALQLAATVLPHLVLLDLGLPDMLGVEVLTKLRTWTNIPILILTVKDDEESKVKLLDAGADDYLTKPFSTPELLARIRVALRHHGAQETTPVFQSGNWRVDFDKRTVVVNDRIIKLTATEFALLGLLVRHQGRVVPQKLLLSEIWGPNATEQSHYLRIYIAQLRKKLEDDHSAPKHILTEPGVGYRVV